MSVHGAATSLVWEAAMVEVWRPTIGAAPAAAVSLTNHAGTSDDIHTLVLVTPPGRGTLSGALFPARSLGEPPDQPAPPHERSRRDRVHRRPPQKETTMSEHTSDHRPGLSRLQSDVEAELERVATSTDLTDTDEPEEPDRARVPDPDQHGEDQAARERQGRAGETLDPHDRDLRGDG